MRFPTSGTIYLDAACFIYTVESHPTYAPLLRSLWEDMAAGRLAVATSELTLMEVLVGAHRSNDPALESDYRRALGDRLIRLLPVDRSVLGRAARLRADRPALRTPDAIHVATAELAECDAFVTNDKSLRTSFAQVVVLTDLE